MRIVGARATVIVPLAEEEALAFIAENHRQGAAIAGKLMKSFGLEIDDELVAVAIFCNPRTAGMQRRYTTELFRLAFKENVRILGGASKLIKYFMSTGAWDLFTYQDTSGEASDVYEHSGMTLVSSKWPTKKVLVRDGLTHTQAENNRRDWFSLEQAVRHGPDALIGTSLGEVYREDGSRKNNVDLFLESGYHLEEVPGDRVYEWRNPNVRFYTYKITSSVDDGYYFGRRAIRGTNVSLNDCMSDPYMGSGGKKFQNWKNHVGVENLKKEVMGIYSTWEEIIKAEKRLIGNLHKEDSNCKNYQPGGTGMTLMPHVYRVKQCPIHGDSVHQGKLCVSCKNFSLMSIQECPLHGKTKHRGLTCVQCTALSHRNMRECSIHGLALHQADRCAFCVSQSAFTQGECSLHGITVFQGKLCLKCKSIGLFSERNCFIHGESIHHGETCMKCMSQRSYSEKICPVHGVSIHKGETCMSCMNEKSYSLKECSIHGESKHKGNVCMKCNAESQLTTRECAIHGAVLHKGNSCTFCSAQKSMAIDLCSIHGAVKFHKGVCVKCRLRKHLSEEECSKHGLAKHRGGKCVKCAYEATFSERECPIHGATKHRGEKCMKCSSAKNWEKRRASAK